MAKRKRLTLPDETGAGGPPVSDAAAVAPEIKSAHPLGLTPISREAPISRQAADAAATAALRELADEVSRARAEGRLLQALPLDQVDAGWLVRDRLAVDVDELSALRDSLRAHGQRAAIEVVDRGAGHSPRYGLISGWRRLTALRELQAEAGEGNTRFDQVLAVLRRPESAGDAYVAMVEENEIRAGLSYYERARIAAKAVEAGVFPTAKIALQRLYASASRARRSKIGSFLTIHHALSDALRFPTAISERLGLALAMRLEAEAEFADRICHELAAKAPQDAAAELAVLERVVKGERPAPQPVAAEEIIPGVTLRLARGEIRLCGPAVGPELQARLAAWLRG
jgi:ParB family chromosome partitioning protein